MKNDYYNTFWTFGNHEPLAMYRRIGCRSTGGQEGSALFLDEWHHWFDSEDCVKAIAKTGANLLHCRFYKGMGWQAEKADFPAVVSFAERCRAHHIRVLAYVQYATLYYEVMNREIPDLEDWAARDENGNFYPYANSSNYFRWMPCVNNPAFVEYEKRIVSIAAEAGCFDGIMIDNAMASRCRCPRCLKLFREYLKKQYLPELLGLPDFDYVRFPSEAALFKETNAEVKDLLMQAAFDFWAESNHASLKKICDHVHDNYPGFLVSGNASSPRRTEGFRCYGMDPGIYRDCFDIVLCQNGNNPHLSGNSLINRIRELMFFAADKIPVNPLSDGDAGNGFSSPALLLAQMLECRVWGGITGDRLVMVPDRGEHLNRKCRQERDPVNQHFMRISAAFRHVFEAEEASIIGCLYSEHAHKWSRSSQLSLLVWEEMLLRKHIPFRLVKSNGNTLQDLDKCSVLIVGGCRCLSDRELEDIQHFMDQGCIVIVESEAGNCDERNRLRAKNPFAGTAAVVSDVLDISNQNQTDWTTAVQPPANMEEVFAPLKSILTQDCAIHASEHIRCRLVQTAEGRILHCINYSGTAVDLPEVYCCGKLQKLHWITEQVDAPSSNVFYSWCMAKLEPQKQKE